MEQLCDRYALEVVPDKKPATQRSNLYSLRRIRRAFEGNQVAAIQPHHVYQYRDHCGRVESKKKANLDLEVLSHMFTKAIQWGVRPDHPMTGKKVTKFSLKSSRAKVYVPDGELAAFASILPVKWQLFVSLAVWTGRRKSELLRVRIPDLLEAGIRFTNGKDDDDTFIVEWTPEIRAIVQGLLHVREKIGSVYLIANRQGQPYVKPDGTTSGVDSIWRRYQDRAHEKGLIKQRFTINDLRRKRSSELPLLVAQRLLRHTTPVTTKKHYRALDEVIGAE
ncbi:MAG: tyrosine-type recombinase/integrase [Halieaceae bacterium]|jgi:integrase|nr:tyrosine-type recombinase/integrase [Halieaceae bacterium]